MSKFTPRNVLLLLNPASVQLKRSLLHGLGALSRSFQASGPSKPERKRVTGFVRGSLLALMIPLTLFLSNLRAEDTAFQAKAVAEGSLTGETRDRVIQIYGPHSTVGLFPTSWRILVYDPTAKQNGRAVTVEGHKVTEIKDGYLDLGQLRLTAYKPDEIIDRAQLLVDSDQALDKVSKMTALGGITLSSVEFYLKKDLGPVQPIWYLTLYADEAGKEKEIGKARLSATTGEIFEVTLNK